MLRAGAAGAGGATLQMGRGEAQVLRWGRRPYLAGVGPCGRPSAGLALRPAACLERFAVPSRVAIATRLPRQDIVPDSPILFPQPTVSVA